MPPHSCFVAKVVYSHEVIDFLKFVHGVQNLNFYWSFPLEVRILSLVIYFKTSGAHCHFNTNCCKLRAVSHLYTLLFYLVFLIRPLNLQKGWIIEKDTRFTVRNRTIGHYDFVFFHFHQIGCAFARYLFDFQLLFGLCFLFVFLNVILSFFFVCFVLRIVRVLLIIFFTIGNIIFAYFFIEL